MKMILVLLTMVILLSGCATPISIHCNITPEPYVEREASVGSIVVSKEAIASRKEWHGLAGGGMRWDSETVRMELIFSGVSGSTLRLTYREYVNDLARPAFFQELTYERDTTEIQFRNTRIRIIEIKGSTLRYVLIYIPTDKCESIRYEYQ
jgi:uncharacterized protein YceK